MIGSRAARWYCPLPACKRPRICPVRTRSRPPLPAFAPRRDRLGVQSPEARGVARLQSRGAAFAITEPNSGNPGAGDGSARPAAASTASFYRDEQIHSPLPQLPPESRSTRPNPRQLVIDEPPDRVQRRTRRTRRMRRSRRFDGLRTTSAIAPALRSRKRSRARIPRPLKGFSECRAALSWRPRRRLTPSGVPPTSGLDH
jgi:hypothetical protein